MKKTNKVIQHLLVFDEYVGNGKNSVRYMVTEKPKEMKERISKMPLGGEFRFIREIILEHSNKAHKHILGVGLWNRLYSVDQLFMGLDTEEIDNDELGDIVKLLY